MTGRRTRDREPSKDWTGRAWGLGSPPARLAVRPLVLNPALHVLFTIVVNPANRLELLLIVWRLREQGLKPIPLN